MKKLIGKLEEYFNNVVPSFENDVAKLEYKDNEYEIWRVSETVFKELEKWSEKFPNCWYRIVEK